MDRLRAALPISIKRCVWNLKYGVLGYPKFTAPDDVVQHVVQKVTNSASILELGCGRGCLLSALRREGWMGSYCGVDISQRAIHDARAMLDQRSSWIASDFESFSSPFKWDVIAMIESICYLKLTDVPAFLDRAFGMLTDSGIIVIRLHDFDKYSKYIEIIEGLFAASKRVSPNVLCVTRDSRTLNTLPAC